MVQVPDEMLEIIDKDRRLVNDWAGLSNGEKQLMIDNYQPEHAYDNKLMRSQALGEFIGTYNRAIKVEPTWFSEEEGRNVPAHTRQVPPEDRPRGSPKQIEEVEEELVIPTGGMDLKELKYFIVEYDKLSEDKKREILKKVDHNTIQLIKNHQKDAKFKNSWRIINSMVEDWMQVHQAGGPLKNLFSPEENKDTRNLKTLGEEFDPSSLKDLLKEWSHLLTLKGGQLDAYDDNPAIPVLIRIANEIGKKTFSDKDIINENFIHVEFEKELQKIWETGRHTVSDTPADSLEKFKDKLSATVLEKYFIEFARNTENAGILQWGILQDLVHKRHRLVFNPEKATTTDSTERFQRYDDEREQNRATSLEQIYSDAEQVRRENTRLTQKVEPTLPDWQLQLQTFRGRGASSKAYTIPLYLVVDPSSIKSKFPNLFGDLPNLAPGDWIVTCGKGVAILWKPAVPNQFTIYDNDSNALITVSKADIMHGTKSDNLRLKLKQIKNSPRSGEKWEDILKVIEDLLKISDEDDSLDMSKTSTDGVIDMFKVILSKPSNPQLTSSRITKVMKNTYDSWMRPVLSHMIKDKIFRVYNSIDQEYVEFTSWDTPNADWYTATLLKLLSSHGDYFSVNDTPNMKLKGFVEWSKTFLNDGGKYPLLHIMEEWEYRDAALEPPFPPVESTKDLEIAIYREFAAQLQLWISQNSEYELNEPEEIEDYGLFG